MSIDHVKSIKEVVINGTPYNRETYPFEKEGKTIYIEEDEDDADIIPKVKDEGVNTLDIVFKKKNRNQAKYLLINMFLKDTTLTILTVFLYLSKNLFNLKK